MITPMDIENKEFKKGFRGYNEEEVDEFLDIVKEDFENLYRENLDLKEKLKLYQEQVSRYKSIEETLNATLITAQTAAEDTCSAANKKAKIIVEEAELKSKQIIEKHEGQGIDNYVFPVFTKKHTTEAKMRNRVIQISNRVKQDVD